MKNKSKTRSKICEKRPNFVKKAQISMKNREKSANFVERSSKNANFDQRSDFSATKTDFCCTKNDLFSYVPKMILLLQNPILTASKMDFTASESVFC